MDENGTLDEYIREQLEDGGFAEEWGVKSRWEIKFPGVDAKHGSVKVNGVEFDVPMMWIDIEIAGGEPNSLSIGVMPRSLEVVLGIGEENPVNLYVREELLDEKDRAVLAELLAGRSCDDAGRSE